MLLRSSGQTLNTCELFELRRIRSVSLKAIQTIKLRQDLALH
jgi:hypothetical protein